MATAEFPHVVEAALAETQSKFALAEALATDIPERSRGRVVQGQETVESRLTRAVQEIVRAGGEARSVSTLQQYRSVAFWVQDKSSASRGFGWVPQMSMTSHIAAWERGVAYADFVANPKQARQTRIDTGGASKDGDPDRVIAGWSSAQRTQAARALVSQPEVAQAVAKDPKARETARAAMLAQDAEQRRRERETYERRQREYQEEIAREPAPTERTSTLRQAHEGVNWALTLAVAHSKVTEVVQGVRERGVTDDSREDMLMWADRIELAIHELRALTMTGDLDSGLATLIREEGGR